MKLQHPTRRTFLAGAAALAAGGASPLFAQQRTKVRIGYLKVLSVDAQLWLAQHLGTWQKEGLDIEPREFQTGIELFQALVGGSLDVLTTAACSPIFPRAARARCS